MNFDCADNDLKQHIREISLFISDYAALLLGAGATCIRIEKNVMRISETLGVTSILTIMPAHVNLTVWDKEQTVSFTNMKKVYKMGPNFNINTQLSRLSWEIADNKIGFKEAVKRLTDIKSLPSEKKWLVLILVSMANAAFCRLFGGDAISMLIVFISTFAGFRLKQILIEYKWDNRIITLSSAFVSAVISAGGHLFGWGSTPEIALGTSVLYLIPGIIYINSVSDLIAGHYVCAFSRFSEALLLTISLSLGLCCGIFLMGLN